MKKINLKPEVSAADLKTLTAGNASADLTLELQDCCPTKQQKAVALQLQSRVAAAFDDLLARKITVDEYNAYRGAAMNAISDVILVCNAHPRVGAATVALPSIESCWDRVKRVLDEPLRKGQSW